MIRKILIASVALLLINVSTGALAATITFRTVTTVKSSVVTLKDVATITGTEPSDELETLASTIVCSAPPPAEAQIASWNDIASSLRSSGIDLAQLRFAGARQVTIKREYAVVSAEELGEAFAEHVSRRTGWERDSFVVKLPKNVQPLPVPVGKRTITVETMPSEDFCGSVTADLNVSVDGKSYSTVSHRFGIERYVEALVAVCKIPRGQPVNKSDVKESKFEQSRVDSGALTKVEQAAGLLAVRTIYPGTVLRAGLLTPPPIIRKGQNASVVWEGTGFNITTKGELLEDGCANELVRVRLPSKKIVKAVVLDAGTLQIAQ